ncbi:POK8 protein, partial [Bucco capensis]|nr:POK8 protein [Bucco capensis]
PMRRFHWKVLPQGMKNSPAICQWYIASLLSPVRAKMGEAIILHYMDDVLVCAPDDKLLQNVLDQVVKVLTSAGLALQEEKVQKMPPWKYLGLEITARAIVPQKLAFNSDPKTLADLHSLCGTLNWVRPWLGIATDDLAPLFNLLKGGEELSSPRSLTPEAKIALEKVETALAERQSHRCKPDLPFKFIVLGKLPHLHGLIFQWDQDEKDSLIIIEWVFLSHHRSKSITKPQELMAQLISKARARLQELAAKLTKNMFEHLLRYNETLQIALENYSGQISVHAPAHKLFASKFQLIPKEKKSQTPLKALTVFTDASVASQRSVITWKNPKTQQWETDIDYVEGSPQIAELAAAVRAFERFSEPFNLVTDSAYVAGVVSRAENAVLREISNQTLFGLLSKLIYAISHREHPYFVMHIRSHTDLPGPIAEGNQRADSLAAAAAAAMVRSPDIFQQAKLSHQMFHQNVPGLVKQFHLKRDQARAIVATCPHCQPSAIPSLGAGVNPRGLESCEVWQTDITHIPEFGRMKYVHVSIDTFSGAIYASAHTGEKGEHAKKHLLQAFSVLGVPKEIKTDNGPAYISKVLETFLQDWGVEHKFGIPHSPTGQAIVERANQSLKRVLEHQ